MKFIQFCVFASIGLVAGLAQESQSDRLDQIIRERRARQAANPTLSAATSGAKPGQTVREAKQTQEKQRQAWATVNQNQKQRAEDSNKRQQAAREEAKRDDDAARQRQNADYLWQQRLHRDQQQTEARATGNRRTQRLADERAAEARRQAALSSRR